MRVAWAYAFLDLPATGLAEEVEFWRQASHTTLSPWRGDAGQFATLLPREGDAWLKVQRVGGSGGVHLDLVVDLPLAEAAEAALAVGAAVVQTLDDVVVCRSPGGFPFCLTRWEGSDPPRQVRQGEPTLPDQLCLDVPALRFEEESRFWPALTGWPLQRGSAGEFAPLARPREIPVRLLLQRLGEPDGPVRGHLDFASADREAATLEHVSVGASVLRWAEHWTVLLDPAGRPYCLTDRLPETGRLV